MDVYHEVLQLILTFPLLKHLMYSDSIYSFIHSTLQISNFKEKTANGICGRRMVRQLTLTCTSCMGAPGSMPDCSTFHRFLVNAHLEGCNDDLGLCSLLERRIGSGFLAVMTHLWLLWGRLGRIMSADGLFLSNLLCQQI